VAAGAPLTFSMLYASGYLALTQEMEALKSAFSLVGIDLTLASTPFNTLLGEVIPPCKPSRGGPNCTWEMADWQNPNSWTYGDSAYPSGGQTLGCGSLVNAGDYCSQTAEQLIQATHTASGLQPMHRYDLFIEQQVPVLRLASPPAQIAAIRSTLHGVVQGPLLALDTQAWRLST
ncbi:extracellular solute-binding protein family 5, partial [mine drainage metagenome]